MWCDKIQISWKCEKPVSKTHQDEQRQCGAQSGVIDKQIFFSTNHRHSLTLNTKLQLQLTIRMALVQDIL